MKKVLFSSVLMLAAAISFAGTPKGETKDAKSETKTEVGATYYWFPTDASGTLTSRIAKVNALSASDPDGCDQGTDYCSLAFDANDTEMVNGQRQLKSTISEGQADAEAHRN